MAMNHVQPGATMPWTNGTGSTVTSGQLIIIGARAAVALGDIAAGAIGNVATEGVFAIPKAAEVLSQGVNLYWDADGNPVGGAAGSGALTATDTANTLAGFAFAIAGETAETVNIKLNA